MRNYHPYYGSMDEHWEKVCKPYADRLRTIFGGKGYFAIVDDERGTFVVVGEREFHADSLDKAFEDALPYARQYVETLR